MGGPEDPERGPQRRREGVPRGLGWALEADVAALERHQGHGQRSAGGLPEAHAASGGGGRQEAAGEEEKEMNLTFLGVFFLLWLRRLRACTYLHRALEFEF